MLAKVTSFAVIGLGGATIEVEVDIHQGLNSFMTVGPPDSAVQEAREDVRTAINNSGCRFPGQRITVNPAPADLCKEWSAYDRPSPWASSLPPARFGRTGNPASSANSHSTVRFAATPACCPW